MFFKNNNLPIFNYLSENICLFNSTFFRSIYLSTKALRRITMRGFLVGVTEPEKSTLKQVQLRT